MPIQVNVAVQYAVYRTSETGTVMFPAAPNGMPYSETWLQTTHTGAVLLTYSSARVAETKWQRGVRHARVRGPMDDTLSWPIMSIASAVLPNGKVLSYGREYAAENPPHYVIPPGRFNGVPYLWDPTSGTFTNVDAHVDLFCSSLAFLPNGNLIVIGGNAVNDGVGQRFNYQFNYQTNSWTANANMADGRWYPSTTVLANGDVFIMSGSDTNGYIDSIPEVYHIASNTYTELTGLHNAVAYWTWPFLAPNGLVFYAGQFSVTYYMNLSGTGSTGSSMIRRHA